MAYGRKGDIGQAELASAQGFFNIGDLKNAQTQASRAMTKLPPARRATSRPRTSSTSARRAPPSEAAELT